MPGQPLSGLSAGFVHLHTHSYYSFLDSTLSPLDIVTAARQAGATAVAITDTNCMSGVVEFYRAARDAGLKPILGAEVRQPFASERELLRQRNNVGGLPPALARDDKGFPADEDRGAEQSASCHSTSPALSHGDVRQRAVLLARDFAGYSEISRVITRRMLDADFDIFQEIPRLSDRVIVLSDSVEVMEVLAASYRENLHFATVAPSRKKRRQNRGVYETALRLGLPLAIAADVRLASPSDASLHTMLQAMRRLVTVHHVKEDERVDPAQYFQTSAEVMDFFGLHQQRKQEGPLHGALVEALRHTSRIADLCDCQLPLGEWKFPSYEGMECRPRETLRSLVQEGLIKRYGQPLPGAVQKRADYELETIDNLHFTEYFLFVNRIVSEAGSRGFFTLGRGSAANSIVTYALYISNVCPIKHDLYFERFLNPERSVPPDIDIDFSWKERDAIIEWCFEYFGQERVALISTIQTFRKRQSIREVAKAHGISESESNQFTRLAETGFRVEEEAGTGRGSRAPRVHDLSQVEPWRTILEQARRVEGFPRHFSVHCGGILITPGPVTDWVPLTRSAKGYAITQLDMYSAEDLGLIKIDLLGNRALGVLKDAINMAESNIPWREQEDTHKDPAAAEAPHEGINTGIFQREAVRMKLAGTRRGTTVALAGVLQKFAAGNDGNSAPVNHATVKEAVFDFSHVTSDPATLALIDAGKTMGCFYIESPGMRALFERLRCRSYEEVVAASSIIRPGVAESGMMQEYISRHQNTGKRGDRVITIHPIMQRILPETHGVMVYQEDVLRVAHEVAGLTYAQADSLRRAMSGKHRSEDAIARLEDNFVAGAMAKQLTEEDAREIWRQISSFAGYSFCKGHSAAFAVLSYQITFLKAHYPAEFFAGVLSNEGGFYGAAAYLEEARRWGITVYGPCINRSEDEYFGQTRHGEREGDDGKTINGWLRIGLMAVSGLSLQSRRKILAARNDHGSYHSLADFMERSQVGGEECRTLIKAGALDCLGSPTDSSASLRPILLLELAEHLSLRRLDSGGLLDFAGVGGMTRGAEGANALVRNQPDSFTLKELCEFEGEALGFSVTAHPVDLAAVPDDVIPARDIRNHAGKKVRMAGLCIARKILVARNSGKPMKMLTMEDRTDLFEAVLFPRIYERFAARSMGKGMFLLEGQVDMTLGSPTLNVSFLERL